MAEQHTILREDGSIVDVVWTDRADGDFHVQSSPEALTENRARVMNGPWATVRQIHGNRVVDAATALATQELVEADAIVTDQAFQPISVQGADCAPIALITDRGAIGVAHAGWRGLLDGVVESAVIELERDGVKVERAIIGPVICTACYEFGSTDLDSVAAELGDDVRGETASGTPALNMRAGIVSAFDKVDVMDVQFVGGCPACDSTGFSHRMNGDTERHCLVAQLRQAG